MINGREEGSFFHSSFIIHRSSFPDDAADRASDLFARLDIADEVQAAEEVAALTTTEGHHFPDLFLLPGPREEDVPHRGDAVNLQLLRGPFGLPLTRAEGRTGQVIGQL